MSVALVAIGIQPGLAAGNQPNIVLIVTDDAGYNEFGFMNSLNGIPSQMETPNLDALANQGVVARQGYVTAPVCATSRAALLTGQYQQRYGFESNLPGPNESAPMAGLVPEQVTIAQRLKDLGYSTGLVGKWHNGYTANYNLPTNKGFDSFFGLWGGSREYYYDMRPGAEMRRGETLIEDQWVQGGIPYINNPQHPDYDYANDPIKGRYVTDAFGDEAAAYVTQHAANQNPYFLYLSFTGPHDPYTGKQQDMEHFAHITDQTERLKAAMLRAVDRNVGKVMNAVQTSGEDTIFVFVNDNGGTSYSNNQPLTGSKGFTWEGGVRVPFFIKAPGLQPGVYDAPVSTLDVLPTLVTAAGGNLGQIPTDGVDLMPHLNRSNLSDPHDVLVWRYNSLFAVRKGDWKLELPNGPPIRLINLANDPNETTNVAGQFPEVVADLQRELTYWDAKMAKSKWSDSGFVVNNFDHFVFKGNSAFFNSPGAWTNALTGDTATLTRPDGYANLILEFRTKDVGNFGATSSMMRPTGLPMMVNELRFTGNFTSQTTPFLPSGIGAGQPLLLVKSLAGNGPKIRLDATSSGTQAKFTFDIGTELQLLDDLEITGDGTQRLIIKGSITDFYEPRNVTKSGTSVIDFTGHSTFKGDFFVLGGEVRVGGPNAAINGADAIVIDNGAKVTFDGGLISVNTIDRSRGGDFEFNTGELRVSSFIGDLANQSGTFAPGTVDGLAAITGNYVETATTTRLVMELGGNAAATEYDTLQVNGIATLRGTLEVKYVNDFVARGGDEFLLVDTVGGRVGTFLNTILPVLPHGHSWDVVYDDFDIRLRVIPQVSTPAIPGDFNRDGVVDGADYVVWRNTVGSRTSLLADGDDDHDVDQDDYNIWRANFGRNTPPASSSSVSVGIPEPTSLVLGVLAAAGILAEIRRRA